MIFRFFLHIFCVLIFQVQILPVLFCKLFPSLTSSLPHPPLLNGVQVVAERRPIARELLFPLPLVQLLV